MFPPSNQQNIPKFWLGLNQTTHPKVGAGVPQISNLTALEVGIKNEVWGRDLLYQSKNDTSNRFKVLFPTKKKSSVRTHKLTCWCFSPAIQNSKKLHIRRSNPSAYGNTWKLKNRITPQTTFSTIETLAQLVLRRAGKNYEDAKDQIFLWIFFVSVRWSAQGPVAYQQSFATQNPSQPSVITLRV